MKGLMTLTWRVSDGVDAKLSYIAEVPWDKENRLVSSRDVYYRYAVKCYGAEAAEAVTEGRTVPGTWPGRTDSLQ